MSKNVTNGKGKKGGLNKTESLNQNPLILIKAF
jgi:hypothetical protein